MKIEIATIDCSNPATIFVVVREHQGVIGELAATIAGLKCDKKLTMASPVPMRGKTGEWEFLYSLGFIISRPSDLDIPRLLQTITPVAVRRGGHAFAQSGCAEFLFDPAETPPFALDCPGLPGRPRF